MIPVVREEHGNMDLTSLSGLLSSVGSSSAPAGSDGGATSANASPPADTSLAASGGKAEDEALQWVCRIIGIDSPPPGDSLCKVLQDGVLLCKVANAINPNAIQQIITPHREASATQVKYSSFENTTAFLDACGRLGVPPRDLFAPDDLYSGNGGRVAACLAALASIAAGAPVPALSPASPGASPFTPAVPRLPLGGANGSDGGGGDNSVYSGAPVHGSPRALPLDKWSKHHVADSVLRLAPPGTEAEAEYRGYANALLAGGIDGNAAAEAGEEGLRVLGVASEEARGRIAKWFVTLGGGGDGRGAMRPGGLFPAQDGAAGGGGSGGDSARSSSTGGGEAVTAAAALNARHALPPTAPGAAALGAIVPAGDRPLAARSRTQSMDIAAGGEGGLDAGVARAFCGDASTMREFERRLAAKDASLRAKDAALQMMSTRVDESAHRQGELRAAAASRDARSRWLEERVVELTSELEGAREEGKAREVALEKRVEELVREQEHWRVAEEGENAALRKEVLLLKLESEKAKREADDLREALDVAAKEIAGGKERADARAVAEALGGPHAMALDVRGELAAMRGAVMMMEKEAFQIAAAGVESMRGRVECIHEKYLSCRRENKELYNTVQDLRGNIRVFCRVRPLLGLPGAGGPPAGAEDEEPLVSTAAGEDTVGVWEVPKGGVGASQSWPKLRHFNFDKVFGPESSQGEVFEDTEPLVRSVLDGFNVCIFAYGQTGSGKTHTMMGPGGGMEGEGDFAAGRWGVVHRALSRLFDLREERAADGWAYTITVEMREIYNERVCDLLRQQGTGGRTKLKLRAGKSEAVSVCVDTPDDVLDVMDFGMRARAVGATSLNERSSRSHCIVTVHCEGTLGGGSGGGAGTSCYGQLHLVDLAGSERVKQSEAAGERLKEAQHINKSLSALGDVIQALVEKRGHVPYRNSMLTTLLRDSLGGQSKVMMFAHVTPEPGAISETLSTLKFAARARSAELGQAQRNTVQGGSSEEVAVVQKRYAAELQAKEEKIRELQRGFRGEAEGKERARQDAQRARDESMRRDEEIRLLQRRLQEAERRGGSGGQPARILSPHNAAVPPHAKPVVPLLALGGLGDAGAAAKAGTGAGVVGGMLTASNASTPMTTPRESFAAEGGRSASATPSATPRRTTPGYASAAPRVDTGRTTPRGASGAATGHSSLSPRGPAAATPARAGAARPYGATPPSAARLPVASSGYGATPPANVGGRVVSGAKKTSPSSARLTSAKTTAKKTYASLTSSVSEFFKRPRPSTGSASSSVSNYSTRPSTAPAGRKPAVSATAFKSPESSGKGSSRPGWH